MIPSIIYQIKKRKIGFEILSYFIVEKGLFVLLWFLFENKQYLTLNNNKKHKTAPQHIKQTLTQLTNNF